MPPTLTWHTFPTPATQAAALAEAVANGLRPCLQTQGHAVLAVSGGRSPVAFFEALSPAKLDWPNVTITLVDERLVPPRHADSNAALVRRHLLQHAADGHTASLFPQAPQLAAAVSPECRSKLVHTSPITAAHERIGMSLNALAAVPQLFLSIQGADKRSVLEQAAAMPLSERPISLLLHRANVHCQVYYAD